MVTHGSSSLQFLTYQDQQVRYPGTPGLQHRVAFVQKDPSQHDASIQLANLQVSDTATYQCRVRKHTLATHEVTITVQGEPRTPQGTAAETLLLARGPFPGRVVMHSYPPTLTSGGKISAIC